MGVTSKRIDFLQLKKIGPELCSVFSAKWSNNLGCKSGFATQATETTTALRCTTLFMVESDSSVSRKRLDKQCHLKAPVQCRCCRLAALHGTRQTLPLMSSTVG